MATPNYNFGNFSNFVVGKNTLVNGALEFTDPEIGDKSSYVYTRSSVTDPASGKTFPFSIVRPSSVNFSVRNSSGGSTTYTFTSQQQGDASTPYEWTGDGESGLPGNFVFTTYNMVAFNKIVTGLNISNLSFLPSTPVYFSNGTVQYTLATVTPTSVNPTTACYADKDTVYTGPLLTPSGYNILAYALVPFGFGAADPTIPSFPVTLGSSCNGNLTTLPSYGGFKAYCTQFFGNQVSFSDRSVCDSSATPVLTQDNILIVPAINSSTGLQENYAVKFFLYVPDSVEAYIYSQTIQNSLPYVGYALLYYDATNTDIADTPFASLALPLSKRPVVYDSVNYPASTGSVSGDITGGGVSNYYTKNGFDFQTWFPNNNTIENAPGNLFESTTAMKNPDTNTLYTFCGAVPLSFPSGVSTNQTYLFGQYSIGQALFNSGTLVVGSYDTSISQKNLFNLLPSSINNL
jgi:hypothetical protein